MSDVNEANGRFNAVSVLIARTITALGLALALAWVGGQVTGVDMWTFVETYSLLFYVCVAGIGALLINPAMRKLRDD